MGRNLAKLATVCLVLAGSIYLSSYAINEYALAQQREEQTIADALIQSQLQAQLEQAEEEAKKELEEAEIELTTEALTTKPAKEEFFPEWEDFPEWETEASEGSAEESTQESTEDGELESTQPPETEDSQGDPEGEDSGGDPEMGDSETEGSETGDSETDSPASEGDGLYEFDLSRGSGTDPSGLLPESEEGIPERSLFSLTEEEQEIFLEFLTEHYFLDGYVYAQQETDPVRRERKELAARMEQSVIDSLSSVMEILPEMLSFTSFDLDVSGIREENRERAEEFRNAYQGVEEHGEEFGVLYEEISDYFDRLDETLALMDEMFSEAAQSTNPLLSAAVLLTRFQNELVPAITEILDLGIGFKPYSNAIYLEGVEGVVLLSQEEVTRVITNPGLALAAAENLGE